MEKLKLNRRAAVPSPWRQSDVYVPRPFIRDSRCVPDTNDRFPGSGAGATPCFASFLQTTQNGRDYIAARCEKLAQGFYTAATWPGIENYRTAYLWYASPTLYQ